ncbi:hypothetical protein D3C84_1218540 [compost metagenome]
MLFEDDQPVDGRHQRAGALDRDQVGNDRHFDGEHLEKNGDPVIKAGEHEPDPLRTDLLEDILRALEHD